MRRPGSGAERARAAGPRRQVNTTSSDLQRRTPWRVCRLLVAAALVALCAEAVPGWAAAPAAPPRLDIAIVSDVTPVFRHADAACDSDDIPDAPARAFRTATGEVKVFAPHWRNRALRGPELTALRPDCAVVLEGAADEAPERYDDRLWIASSWTADGRIVHALLHGEYQGHRHPGRCATGRYTDCWYNAISLALSDDGGASFTRRPGGDAIIAAPARRYDPAARRHIGFFSPSNILHHDGAWFVLVFTEGFALPGTGVSQPRGTCLLRAQDIAEPASWKAWDGAGFEVRLSDPYQAGFIAPAHRCTPVSPRSLRWLVTSVVRHAPSGAFIALMQGSLPSGRGEAPRDAIFASASWDLVSWSPATVVMEVGRPGSYRCGDPPPIAYPSLLDPSSPDRNFGTVGDTAELFMTRFNVPRCRLDMDRDLVRRSVSIRVDR